MNSIQIGLSHYLVLSWILFLLGFLGIIICKNLIKILLCLEILINSVCINFVAISYYIDGIKLEGAAFTIFIIMLSFVNTVILVSLIINIFKHKKSLDVKKFRELKG